MQKKLVEFNMAQRKTETATFQAGDVVKVYRKIKEGDKERTQVFEGMIIAIKGRQSSSQILTVRKVSGGIGVELIIPANSPMIEKIELVKRAKVRRAKLYYVREKTAKSLRFKYDDASVIEAKANKKAEKEEDVKEEVATEEGKKEEVVVEEKNEEMKSEEVKEVKVEDKKEAPTSEVAAEEKPKAE